jgi:hypothetical protein
VKLNCFLGAGDRNRPVHGGLAVLSNPSCVARAIANPVLQFLTSGDANQEISDDGLVRELFVDALNGRATADLNGDGYITGTQLGWC